TDRVRPRPLPRGAPRTGLDPRGAPRAGVGLRRSFRGAHRRFAHPDDPAQAGVDDRAHRARRRLRGRGGTGNVRVKRPRTPERPLNPLPTLKLKISVIILAAVAVTVSVFFIGLKVGLWPSFAGVLSGLVALAVVWVLARGLTSPLREMVSATEAMARGDFTARV